MAVDTTTDPTNDSLKALADLAPLHFAASDAGAAAVANALGVPLDAPASETTALVEAPTSQDATPASDTPAPQDARAPTDSDPVEDAVADQDASPALADDVSDSAPPVADATPTQEAPVVPAPTPDSTSASAETLKLVVDTSSVSDVVNDLLAQIEDLKSQIPPEVGTSEFSEWLAERFDAGYAVVIPEEQSVFPEFRLEVLSRDGRGGKIGFRYLSKA